MRRRHTDVYRIEAESGATRPGRVAAVPGVRARVTTGLL
ncbi:hypothetical protein SBD_0429 [Streptomyces bottropensis ATCC 25435]|uniref:Uncharacterized protein n=1 Tax=Streptomyces bottropensis ATCC 25435 TaxID=1054862 RepID=M3DLG3_9ACTN|nr:hypothetical protein SBD_0429 [Streptomyces bottropensis ATCC 25435]